MISVRLIKYQQILSQDWVKAVHNGYPVKEIKRERSEGKWGIFIFERLTASNATLKAQRTN